MDVFISYKREEYDAVALVAEKLRALSFDVWFDDALRSGDSFDEEIANRLRSAKAVLVCWTPAAMASDWVRAEAALAHGEGKLLACFLEPTALIPPFNLVHAENLMAWAGQEDDKGWLNLLSRLGEILSRQGAASYYRIMRPDAPLAELRAWALANGADPLAEKVWERIRVIEGEDAHTRVAREKAEARTRDVKRGEAAARSKALAKARGLRDPKEQARRMLRITAAIAGVGVLAGGGVGYSIYSGDQLRELDRTSDVEGIRAFLTRNSWGPIHSEGLRRFSEIDDADWNNARASGSVETFESYIAAHSGVPEGKYLAVAGQALESARRVADAQRLLTRLRLYDGRADGKLDDITSDAVSLFQYRRGEIVTGEVDVDLLNQLRKAVEDRIATPPSKIRPGRVGPPTEDEYRKVAARLRLDGATLMAVRRVEATEGFTADGRMRILFEANVFSRLTDHRYDDTHPHISSRLWSRELYPKTRDGVWAQLQDAFVLDPVAAYSSATYGAYQLLGTHYKAAGFETPAEFALFMSESEANQLEVFVRWLGSERVDSVDRLRAHDWESFARAYNGPGYAASGYHVKLANAYAAALSSLAQTSSTPAQQPE